MSDKETLYRIGETLITTRMVKADKNGKEYYKPIVTVREDPGEPNAQAVRSFSYNIGKTRIRVTEMTGKK
jgi:uncharacterized protein YegL